LLLNLCVCVCTRARAPVCECEWVSEWENISHKPWIWNFVGCRFAITGKRDRWQIFNVNICELLKQNIGKWDGGYWGLIVHSCSTPCSTQMVQALWWSCSCWFGWAILTCYCWQLWFYQWEVPWHYRVASCPRRVTMICYLFGRGLRL